MAEYEPWEDRDPRDPFSNDRSHRTSGNSKSGWDSNLVLNLVLIVALFAMGLWPFALYFLIRLLGGNPAFSGKQKSRQTGPRTAGKAMTKAERKQQRKEAKKQVSLGKGRAFKIWGGILTAIGALATWDELWSGLYYGNFFWLMEDLAVPVGMLAAGLALLISGIQRGRKSARFDHYLRLIGTNQRISVRALAEAMPASQKQVCDDLQEMIQRGYFEKAYLDMGHGVLVLSGEGLRENEPEPGPEQPPVQPEPAAQDPDAEENEFLRRIRAANDAIANPTLSAQIDRIEELTRKIFVLLQEHPEKEKELRSFTNYYLPQTLKILEAYSKLEAQGVEGDNITQAKQRIEAMMDKLVDGYAQQLDRLFSSDVLDITAEIAVMESMLAKDGLTKEGVLYPEARD